MQHLKYAEIKKFYDQIEFPGRYSKQNIDYYQQDISNGYLNLIDRYIEPEQEILDVGAGTGFITNLFAQRYPSSKFTAVDMSDSIQYGKKFAENNNIKNVNWVQQNFLNFSTHKKYDRIICQGVLHHIPDFEQASELIQNLLSPNGMILVGVYHPFGKFLQKISPMNYTSTILQQDQNNHPFALAFSQTKITKLFKPFTIVNKFPRYFASITKSYIQGGGLILYVLQKSKQ